jgi:hypothetical protein
MSNTAISKTEAVKALQRAKTSIANFKRKTQVPIRRTVNGALTVGAGWAVGVTRANYGEGAEKRILVPGLEMDADLLGGGALLLAGIMGFADEYSDSLCAIGSGALAGYAALEGFQNAGIAGT